MQPQGQWFRGHILQLFSPTYLKQLEAFPCLETCLNATSASGECGLSLVIAP